MWRANDQRLFKQSSSEKHDRSDDVFSLDDEIIAGISPLKDRALIKDVQDRLSRFTPAPPGFLGMPVNWPFRLKSSNKEELKKELYLVAPKPKGVRCLLYNDPIGEMFLENNTHERHIFKLNHDCAPQLIPNDTVLDGIVVRKNNNRDEEAKGELTFFIMDAVRCLGEDLTQKRIQERIHAVQVKIIKPRSDAIRYGIIRTEREVFNLDFARYKDKSLIGKFLTQEFMFKYPIHLLSYLCGNQTHIFQWGNNKVFSFRLEISPTSPHFGYLRCSGSDQRRNRYATIYLTDELRNLDGFIIECRYVDHKWVFDRIRNDRIRPNGLKTIEGKMNDMRYSVKFEDLLAVCLSN